MGSNILIEIDGITIEIQRKPIKNMHLRIYPPDGRVQVSAPLKLSLQHICSQLEAKREWLHKQRARMQTLPPIPDIMMQTGEHHYYLGQAYALTVVEGLHAPQITLNNSALLLKVKQSATAYEKQAYLTDWYRAQMQALIPDLIKKWQPIIGVTVAEWGVKSMKTRWGSCNIRARRIWLNLALIKKPMPCLESVLVHEMVHLLEASHNARFYSLMDKFMPDWRDHQKVLYL